jgi:hypothetical protein
MITLASPVVLLSLYSIGLHPVVFTARGGDCPTLPVNIQAERSLAPVITQLMARSLTLRAQCLRIAASPATHVSITATVAIMEAGTRARSFARRYLSGLLVVEVQIPPAARDFAELLAHELEHVSELIDGVHFEALAAAGNPEIVRRRSDGSFESERARRAGMAAAAEVARRGSRQ